MKAGCLIIAEFPAFAQRIYLLSEMVKLNFDVADQYRGIWGPYSDAAAD